MSKEIADVARLLAEPTRTAMLLQLMDGRAVPAGELARTARVSPQTASEHLARLAEAGFVMAQRIGRHRYYALANEKVAYVVDSLLVLSSPPRSRPKIAAPTLGSIEHARTCYAHLAGWVGVAITDALQREGYLTTHQGHAFAVTESGNVWFNQLGITVASSAKNPDPKLTRQCLDWTERRPHLGGTLGVALYRRFVELGWIKATPKSRAVRVTLEGRESLLKHLRLPVG